MTENNPEDRRPLKSRSYAWVGKVATWLVQHKVTPNLISMVGIGFAGLGFVFGYLAGNTYAFPSLLLLLMVVMIQGRLLCNLFDGLVAVEGGLKAKGGAMFNEIPDRIEDALFFVGAGYACGHVQLGWLCAALAIFIAYLRAFGASLGQGQDFGGPQAKQHRMFLLTVGCLGQAITTLFSLTFPVLEMALRVSVAGCVLTAILRISRMYRKSE